MRVEVLAVCFVLAACEARQPNAAENDPNSAATSAPPATPQTVSTAVVTMGSVGELSPVDENTPALRGGRPLNPKDWPASLYSHAGGGSCTSTLVGQRVLFTAAHCVPNGGQVTFKLGGADFSGRCEHAAEYATNPTADYALCAIDKPVPNIPFERVNADPAAVAVKTQLLLTGYGCTRDDGTGGNDNVYRGGEAAVTALPKEASNDIVTKGRVALCFGDSGGPAFLISGAKRTQVSVNSRVSALGGGQLGDTSFLSSSSTPTALGFMRSWAKRNALEICGVTAAATGCR